MGQFKDLTGQRFGRLTVVKFAERKGQYTYWECQCDCGKKTIVYSYSLTSGRTQSCGCLHNEITAKISTRHNLRNSKAYRAWRHMNHRCFNVNDKDYSNYGGRGITVYDEWAKDFVTFYDYVSKLEHFGEEGYSLDRINVNGNYEPGNVRWATRKEQARNKRTNLLVNYNGEMIPLSLASEISNISYNVLQYRYYRGKRGSDLFKPVKQTNSADKSSDSAKLQSR